MNESLALVRRWNGAAGTSARTGAAACRGREADQGFVRLRRHCYRSKGWPEAVTPWYELTGVRSTGHGAQLPIAITFVDKESPITKGLEDWTTIHEELYNNKFGLLDTVHPLAHGKQTYKDKKSGEEKTDDDVVVRADWLCSYAAAFSRWPDAALFGGRIIPVLEEPVTPWFPDAMPHLGLPLAARNLADTPIALRPDGDTIPFGANYAVRTAVQRLFPFEPKLGSGTP